MSVFTVKERQKWNDKKQKYPSLYAHNKGDKAKNGLEMRSENEKANTVFRPKPMGWNFKIQSSQIQKPK